MAVLGNHCCILVFTVPSLQDLSNMLWALASLGITPEPAWLQQHMQEVHRRQLQKQVAPQHYGNIGWALAKMGHRWVGGPTTRAASVSLMAASALSTHEVPTDHWVSSNHGECCGTRH